MSGLKADEQDVLSFVRPDTLLGALAYLAIFLAVALLLSRALRAAVHAAMTRKGHIDRTSISFLQQICTALIWEQARKLAQSVAADSAGEKSVIGCFLTKMNAASITLELRLVAADAGGRDLLRSKLMVSLAERFNQQRIDPNDTHLPAFS